MTTRQQWTGAIAWQIQDINKTNDPQKKYRLGTVSKKDFTGGLKVCFIQFVNFRNILWCSFEFPFYFCNHPATGESWLLYYYCALAVLGCQHSKSLPRGVLSLSVVYYYDISCSFQLVFMPQLWKSWRGILLWACPSVRPSLRLSIRSSESVTFPLVSWVRCGTWLYRFLIFPYLLWNFINGFLIKNNSPVFFLFWITFVSSFVELCAF